MKRARKPSKLLCAAALLFACGLVHERLETAGKITPENVHPFVSDADEKRISFAHNGTLDRRALFQELGDSYHPRGSTDSEAYFEFLLRNLNPRSGALLRSDHPTPDEMKDLLVSLASSVMFVRNNFGKKCNALLDIPSGIIMVSSGEPPPTDKDFETARPGIKVPRAHRKSYYDYRVIFHRFGHFIVPKDMIKLTKDEKSSGNFKQKIFHHEVLRTLVVTVR